MTTLIILLGALVAGAIVNYDAFCTHTGKNRRIGRINNGQDAPGTDANAPGHTLSGGIK